MQNGKILYLTILEGMALKTTEPNVILSHLDRTGLGVLDHFDIFKAETVVFHG